MATATITDCSPAGLLTLERVKYFPRQLLTADDMVADQEYFRVKLRRHNRFLHGWGVVCGMEVTIAPTTERPWQVTIGAGYALGPFGDEIYISKPFLLDLARCGPGAQTDPCDPDTILGSNRARTGATIFIAIRYEECLARPIRVMPGGCGCEETLCQNSRIRDSFQLDCLPQLPASHTGAPGPSICDLLAGRALAQCLPCPSEPWVVLAQVTLPAALATPLAQTQIDNFIRRQVFSTAAIQDQVIRCCCGPRDRRPARVTSINPPAGAQFPSATAVPPAVVATFSKNLQPATINNATFQVLRFVPGQAAVILQGQVSYDDGNRSAQFTAAQPFTIPGVYQVTIVGSGPSAIMDSDNLALDGNDDGVAGGNFISQFTVLGPTPSPTPTPTVRPTPTPTPASGPLTGEVIGPAPVPTVARNSEVATVGDLRIRITGGTPGQQITNNIRVTLNTRAAGAANDTAQLVDETGGGAVISGAKTANSYDFGNVNIKEPGLGGQQVFRITNMKVNPASLPTTAPPTVVAFVATTGSSGSPAVPLANPQQTVAQVG